MRDRNTIEVTRNTKLQRIIRTRDGWLLWLSTNDYRLGTYLTLHNNGVVQRIVTRVDEGDDIMLIRPRDEDA